MPVFSERITANLMDRLNAQTTDQLEYALEYYQSEFATNLELLGISLLDDPTGDLDDSHALNNVRHYAEHIGRIKSVLSARNPA